SRHFRRPLAGGAAGAQRLNRHRHLLLRRPQPPLLLPQGAAMSADFQGKVALVTGGSRGIGRAVAEEFAARRATVVVQFRADRRAADATLTPPRGGGRLAAPGRAGGPRG